MEITDLVGIELERPLVFLDIEGTGKRKAVLTYNDPEQGWGEWTGKIIRFNTVTRKVDAPRGKFRALTR